MKTHYQVLARKYRPKNFHELIGQDHVARALANAIDNNRLHHAYLFTGTRGVGKTTIARILSKCLNCETGVTSTPCGQCHVCRAIDEGQFIDLIEIDAASRTKVEDTRDLLENVPYAPTQGRFKVYLIDEVHMLSTHSFNALLKTLEEPPSHVKFLFATTDPQKLPITIVSRCLQFVLRPLPQELLVEHLKQILAMEHIDYSQSALWQLAAAGKGSVRDSLSLTDQAIAFGGGVIADDTVSAMLGLINSTDVLDLLQDIYKDERSLVANHISTMRSKMVDAGAILDKMADTLHKLSMVQVLPGMPLDMNDDDKKALSALSQLMDSQTLQLYYDIVIKSRETLKFASTPMQALEMAILRLLAFRPLAAHQYPVGSPQYTQPQQTLMDDAVSLHHLTDKTASKIVESPNNQTDEPSNHVLPHADDIDALSALTDGMDAMHANTQKKTAATTNDDGQRAKTDEKQNLDDDAYDVSKGDAPRLSDDYLQGEDDGSKDFADDLIDGAFADGQLDGSDFNHDDFNNGFNSDFNNDFNKGNSVSAVFSDHYLNSDGLNSDGLNINTAKPINNTSNVQTLASMPEHGIASGDVVSGDVQAVSEVLDAPSKQQITNANSGTPKQIDSQSGDVAAAEAMRHLSPQSCDLTQSWTDEKWDYWVYRAISHNLLSADEIALVQNALIEGDVQGAARLLVPKKQRQIEVSFQRLAPKILADVGTSLVLAEADIEFSRTPAMRQQLRDEQVVQYMTQVLISSPVVQYLNENGFVEDLPIQQTKLISLTQ